jgi:hypothetical protein
MSNEGVIWTDLSLFPSKAVAKGAERFTRKSPAESGA